MLHRCTGGFEGPRIQGAKAARSARPRILGPWNPGTLALLTLLLTGCAGAPRAEVQAQAGLKNELQRIEATVGDVLATVARVDQSTHHYDAWTLRLQTLAPWLLGVLPLSYLSGKLVWIASRKTLAAIKAQNPKPKGRRDADAPQPPSSTLDPQSSRGACDG